LARFWGIRNKAIAIGISKGWAQGERTIALDLTVGKTFVHLDRR